MAGRLVRDGNADINSKWWVNKSALTLVRCVYLQHFIFSMILRYSRPQMTSLWSEEAKLSRWMEIEILACEAMATRRIIPRKDARTIRRRAKFDIRQVHRNEARTRHDVLAFLEDVASHVGPAGRWIHQGLTSSDILDTTLAWQLRDAADLLIEGVRKVKAAAAMRARNIAEC
ncbi:MAG: hypothetical protein NTZ01_04625 [Verrucomicrobia bacterium]|nr:hypothetical protein [Verrucomicrobiota bacterium]